MLVVLAGVIGSRGPWDRRRRRRKVGLADFARDPRARSEFPMVLLKKLWFLFGFIFDNF
jgi:hypothetical protein